MSGNPARQLRTYSLNPATSSGPCGVCVTHSGARQSTGGRMYTRLVTFTGAADIDGGLNFVRDTVAPMLREQHGFRGITAGVDRSQGVLGVLSLFDTEADRDASESAMAKVRE